MSRLSPAYCQRDAVAYWLRLLLPVYPPNCRVDGVLPCHFTAGPHLATEEGDGLISNRAGTLTERDLFTDVYLT